MNVKQQLTIDDLIESFKSKYSTTTLYNNPSIIEALEYLQINNTKNKNNTDMANTLRYALYIKEALDDYDKMKVLNWPSIECPFFTDEEIEQLKDYYNESGSESYHDYFNENTTTIYNSDQTLSTNRSKSPSYSQRILRLQDQIKNSNDPNEIDSLKQNLVDIGWNPEIEYTPESQIMARERFINLMNERMMKVDMIDIRPLIEKTDEFDYVNEATKKQIYPVSIVLVQGDSLVSRPISNFTGCDFSHSALALDRDFTKLYSFNFGNNIKIGGGFSLESIKNYPQNNRLGIYTFFVNKDDYNKISDRLQYLLLNIKKTTYSLVDLLLFPFKMIKYNAPDKMICSQFVDSCMKMINVDITGMDSSKVSPAKLYTSSINNSKIYKTYDGPVKDFNSSKTYKFLNKLSKTAKVINESNIINNYIHPIVTEARKANIEIKDNGDVLLTNPMVNFDSEYMASHKLLVQYDKANNIEGMKYELARLYYMNYILEKRLYHNKFLINKEKNMKTRARVLNDFNKYIKVVLNKEPNFNFGKYYEQSQFYPHTIEVKGSTVNAIKDIINYIL